MLAHWQKTVLQRAQDGITRARRSRPAVEAAWGNRAHWVRVTRTGGADRAGERINLTKRTLHLVSNRKSYSGRTWKQKGQLARGPLREAEWWDRHASIVWLSVSQCDSEVQVMSTHWKWLCVLMAAMGCTARGPLSAVHDKKRDHRIDGRRSLQRDIGDPQRELILARRSWKKRERCLRSVSTPA